VLVVGCFKDSYQTTSEPCTAAESTEEPKVTALIPYVGEASHVHSSCPGNWKAGWDRTVPSHPLPSRKIATMGAHLQNSKPCQ